MRIKTLDYLRGLMALGIMLYHYFSYTFHDYESDSFFGIIGIYGVSIFYILSGLTLFHVYNKKLSLQNVFPFFIKRIFRILPLLWLSIFLCIIVLEQSYDLKTIILNISGLFGFIAHSNYIPTGAWSIGNELVFYSLFPIIIILSKWRHYFIELFFILSVFVEVYFAFWELSDVTELGSKWSTYINPLNQIFLFIGGILIGKITGNKKNNFIGFILFMFCILFLLFYQVSGNKINLVSEWNRLIYSAIAFIITIAFQIIDPTSIHKNIDWLLSKLGHISYSVYLLHPIVFWFIARYINRTESPIVFLSICIIITLILSFLSYNYIELKCINTGKSLLTKIYRQKKI